MSSLQQAFVNQTHPPRLLAYGFQFGPNSPPIENIETVTSEHIFLFRVHHPQSHVQYDERFGFVAGKYKYGYTMGQAQLDYMSIVQDRPRFSDLVRRHVLNEGNTPFVSTTFNLAWALARAASICQKRRVNARDVLIAVIHAAFISRGSFFALEFLHDEQQMDSDKVRRWANADQEVLVPLHITASAIAACVSQEALELNMYAIPRWFLTEHGTLDNQNLTSREFMARARQRFTTLQVLPMDAIGDAVRFSFILLHSWMFLQGFFDIPNVIPVHSMIFRAAYIRLTDIAYEIVRWPGLASSSPLSDLGFCPAQLWDWEVVRMELNGVVWFEILRRFGHPIQPMPWIPYGSFGMNSPAPSSSGSAPVIVAIAEPANAAVDDLANRLLNSHIHQT